MPPITARNTIHRSGIIAAWSIAVILLASSAAWALNVYNSQEAEAGSVSNAAILADSSASGASAVKFGTGGASWPASPPALICGNNAILGGGPSTAPSGAVSVPSGNNSSVDFSQANTTYWFAPGVHTLGSGAYTQIIPGNNATFVGAPGAILDGQHLNYYAFTQHATGVTIRYLTIRNFGINGGNNNEGVVNHDAGHNWTIEYNTVTGNAGAGVFVGTGNVLRYNCLTQNQQYGFSSYDPDGLSNVVLDHNEISYNNTYDWENVISGCGCTGGGKFWDTHTADITNNYVHHNYSVGIWADTNNTDFLVSGNYISDNDNVGFFYEISYNAVVSNNNFMRNGRVAGADNTGFPTAAVYLSESGGDSRVASRTALIDVYNNNFEDNWGGVALWENADRFCNSPANTSSDTCTLVNPTVAKLTTCVAGTIDNEPYFSDCRWKTKNVKVHSNTFKSTPANIGPTCTFANHCGLNAVISNWGTYPSWSPYQATVVQDAITFSQGNVFSSNTYTGSWQFEPFDQGTFKTFAQWRASPYNQDAGSTLSP